MAGNVTICHLRADAIFAPSFPFIDHPDIPAIADDVFRTALATRSTVTFHLVSTPLAASRVAIYSAVVTATSSLPPQFILYASLSLDPTLMSTSVSPVFVVTSVASDFFASMSESVLPSSTTMLDVAPQATLTLLAPTPVQTSNLTDTETAVATTAASTANATATATATTATAATTTATPLTTLTSTLMSSSEHPHSNTWVLSAIGCLVGGTILGILIGFFILKQIRRRKRNVKPHTKNIAELSTERDHAELEGSSLPVPVSAYPPYELEHTI